MQCPNCGAPISRKNPGVLSAVCEFCDHLVYWNDDAILDRGQRSHLAEGYTFLFRDARGRIGNDSFWVLGRVRYQYPRGIWDEWYVELGGEMVWISEDDHELSLQRRVDDHPLTLDMAKKLTTGSRINIKGKTFFVQECGQAQCVGVEGQLPKYIEEGERYRFVNGTTNDGRYALSIECDDEPPGVFVGSWYRFSDVYVEGDELRG